MIELFGYSLSGTDIAILVSVAMLIGMAKTGVAGAGMIAVPLLALSFGGKASSGLMLPFLIMADVFAITYYHKHVHWSHLRQLLPYAVVGIIIGTFVGHQINDFVFRSMMAAIIFLCLAIMVWQEKGPNRKIPNSTIFATSSGVLGGFTSMVGNLAGPIMSLYLLLMRLPKNQFIGTAAWFFMTVNLVKMPFHIFVWHTVTINSVLLNLCFIPAVALGALVGIKIIQQVSEKSFRIFIIAMTAIAAIAMLV